jgi:hypothetical protein
VLTSEDRERIHREVVRDAELRRELQASGGGRGAGGGQGAMMLVRKLGSKVVITTIIGLFGTLFTVMAAAYHSYFTVHEGEVTASDQVRTANREQEMSVLATFPNEIETSHSLLALLQNKKIWLAAHRAQTDTDELGRSRQDVEQQYWEVYKRYLRGKKPSGILAGVKVFFDSKEVVDAADKAAVAFAKESAATTESELRQNIVEAQALVERLTAAMTEEVKDATTRPKGGKSRDGSQPKPADAERVARTLNGP